MQKSNQASSLTPAAKNYLGKMTSPFIFWWAMLFKLPSAVFWRLKMKSLSPEKCEVTIPYFGEVKIHLSQSISLLWQERLN